MLINRLSRLMGDRRASIQDVARATGMSYTTVFKLYHGTSTRLDLETLDRLCGYFGVGPGAVFEWVPDGQNGGGSGVRRRGKERDDGGS